MNKALMSVIIPVFNKWELTEQCLKSIQQHTPQGIVEVIVINNASSDKTELLLDELGKNLFGDFFTSFHNKENMNFGPASNLGAKHAKADLLFFLNNDTILTPNWYLPLLKHTQETKNFGAVGPLLLYPDNTVQHLGVGLSPFNIFHLYANFPHHHPLVKKTRPLNVITGAAFLTPKEVFWKAGGFFEEYKNGFEDVDLCYHIGQMGLKISCVPESVIYHLESQSPGRKTSEKDNHRLINQRIGYKMPIDLHRQALRDGLHICLSEDFDICVILSEEQSRELMHKPQANDIDGLHSLLAENPLWLEGRVKLAKAYTAREEYAKSCVQWVHAIRMRATREYCREILHISLAHKNKVNFDITEKVMASIEEKMASSRIIIKTILKRVYYHNDKYLIDLYEKELAKQKTQT